MSSAVNGIIAVGIWYLLTPHVEKSFFEVGLRNRYAVLGILATLALQLYVTNYSSLLLLEPLSAEEWLKNPRTGFYSILGCRNRENGF
jgi:hypothetical protein